jgi:PKD repeat protein
MIKRADNKKKNLSTLKTFFIILIFLICIPIVSAEPTWISISGCWTASDGSGNTLIKWNASGTKTWVVPVGVNSVEYLVVSGGGGGGSAAGTIPKMSMPAGGGAGGVLNNTGYSVKPGDTLTIIVGTGGARGNTDDTACSGKKGVSSSFGNISTNITPTYGGGGGCGFDTTDINGGSGGGGGNSTAGGTGVVGPPRQGYNGGSGYAGNKSGGGGGGASMVGYNGEVINGGDGGDGRLNSITSVATYYGGGGGGGANHSSFAGTGGLGGGGNTNTAGTVNTGGGGGAGSFSNNLGGAGGSGVVIIKYTSIAPIASFTPIGLTQGNNSKSVSFTDTSMEIPTSWTWGAKNTTGNNSWFTFSTTQNPTQVFHVGNFTINLTATNAAGSSTSSQSSWVNVSPSTLCQDGGTFSAFSTYGTGYRSVNELCTVEMWNATGTTNWVATGNVTSDSIVSYVVVGGGGGGGYDLGGGGGGAGGYAESTITGLTGVQTVTVGTGGVVGSGTGVSGGSGGNSVFASITSNGGSGGGSRAASGTSVVVKGASTGGGASPTSAGTGASNVSNQEGYGRGGGTGVYVSSTSYSGGGGGSFLTNGTNAATTNAGDGGNAINTTITGTNITLAGGGGGGSYSTTSSQAGIGGANGTTVGGRGGYRTNAATAAVARTGSGGGGGGSTGDGSAGSSGLVIIRYNNITGPSIPVASFTPTGEQSGISTKSVDFTDTSTNTPTSWVWGAKNTTGNNSWFNFATTQNPTQVFQIGNFTINLTATNSAGSHTSTQITWVNVSATTNVPPIVSFTPTGETTDITGLKSVQFTDGSVVSITTWNWSYQGIVAGNNTKIIFSTTQNPLVSFGVGNFSIKLNVTNSTGFNESTISSWVNVTDQTPPLSITGLTNTTGTTVSTIDWSWTNPTTSDFNHTMIYRNGTFLKNVSNATTTEAWIGLPVSTAMEIATHTVDITGNVNMTWVNRTTSTLTPPIVNFSANSTGGIQSVAVQFTSDSITSITDYNWSFGNGNYSILQNPVFVYDTPGIFNVGLNVTNASGYNLTTKNAFITITGRVLPIVNFTYNSTGGIQPVAVQFTSDSITSITDYNWSFGNGNYSTSQNPSFVYDTTGTFSVGLNVTNASGYNTTTKTNIITITAIPYTTAAFTSNVTIGTNYGMYVNFEDLSTNSPTSWYWDFGDGGTSTSQNPTYIYDVARLYNVSLRSTNAYGSDWENKSYYINLTTDIPNVGAWSHFDGADDGTIIIDEMGSALSSGGVVTSWDQFKFGNASLYSSAGWNYLSTPNSSRNWFGNGAFTLEGWMYPTSTGAGDELWQSKTNKFLSQGWGLYHGNSSAASNDWHFFMGNSATNSTDAFTIPLNTWTHVAIQRYTNGTVFIYLNGNYTTSKSMIGVYDTTNPYRIGRQGLGSGSNSFIGYTDEARGSNAVRWYSNFTPPTEAYRDGITVADINPMSTFRFKTDTGGIADVYNQTGGGVRNRTIQLQNVNNATYIVGSMTFEPDYLYVKSMYPNYSTWNDVTIVSSTIFNELGYVEFNVTRPGGFAPGTTRSSFIDAQMLYWNYTPQNTISASFFGYGILINGSTQTSYPVHNFIETDLTMGGWDFFPDFTSNVTTGFKPLSVQFNDTTIGYPTYWNFSWGDGTWTNGTEKNPIHTYSSVGTYSVSLYEFLVWNMSVTNSTTKTNYITVTEGAAISNFNQNVTEGLYVLDVLFTDTSSNAPTSWDWNFGDGSTSSSQNPVHSYSTGGNYTIVLNASNSNTTAYYPKTSYVDVWNHTSNDFSASVTSGNVSFSTTFTDTSYNATSWYWDFGDGNTSTTKSPSFTYSVPGVYWVNHSSSNDHDTYWTNKSNYITAYPPYLAVSVSNFNQNVTEGLYVLDVLFTDTSSNSPTTWNWNFGDGATSSIQNPTHSYSSGGNYTIVLNASNGNTSAYYPKTSYVDVWNHTSNDFSASVTSGNVSFSTTFTDTSYNATSWYWDFGDGNTSTTKSPSFTYSVPGVYWVNHSSSNDHDTYWTNKSNYITAYPAFVTGSVSSFTTNVSSGFYNLPVQFTDTSSNSPTSWQWDFDDGGSSILQNPTHIYSSGGLYNISLIVHNANLTTTISYNEINVWNYTQVGFTANVTNGIKPAAIKFTRNISSDNATQWNMSFGDGSWDNSSSDPTHTYTTLGVFTVTQYVSNDYDKQNSTKNNYITITELTPVSSFSANITKGQEPLSVLFTDASTNTPTSWNYQFGDGFTSNLQNPTHTYSNFGLYTVILNATNTNTSTYYPQTRTNYINVTENIVTTFTVNTTTGEQNNYFQFTDTSNNATSWLWTFGDGTTSTLKNPVKQYTQFGVFTVSLNASTDTDSMILTKPNYITITEIMLTDFSAVPTSGNVPLNVAFTDLSTNATSWSWNFGDGGVSALQNPNYIYNVAGTFTVSLTSSSATDSNSTTKLNYITVDTAPIADFTYTDPFSQVLPISVTFTDTSLNTPTAWSWTFGDGGVSNLQNPTHVYNAYGSFTVTLTATNAFGFDIVSKTITLNYSDPDKPFIFNGSCSNCSIPIDIANGTYTSGIFGNMILTDNMSIWEIASGTSAPWMDAWQNATGSEDGKWIIFMIIWTLFLMFIMLATGNTTLPLIAGIGTASAAAIIMPSMVLPVFTMFFALCAGAIGYKLFIDG